MLLDHLKNKHKGCPVYIIGKGKTLNHLTKGNIQPGAVIITINHAITVVEQLNLNNPVYSLQKDDFTNQVKPSTHLLVHVHESAKRVFAKPTELFDNLELGLKVQDFSAMTAIQIAKLMGCSKFYFVSFDSMTFGDRGVFNHDEIPDYASNYEIQAKKMRDFIDGLDYEWITPTKEL